VAVCAIGPLLAAGCSDDSDGASGRSTTTTRFVYTPCQIHKSLETMDLQPAPRTPQEGRASVQYIVDVYTAVADAAPPERAAAAQTVRTGMVNLQEEASSQNYSGAFLTQPPASLQNTDFSLAKEVFREDYAKACDTTTTTGGGTTTPTTAATATSGG
jgi:hypothetical protein